MARQDGLPSRPSVFYIHEQALRLPVGGKKVMNEQLLKLAPLVDPVVNLVHGSLMIFMEDRSYVDRYAKQVSALSRVALSTDESRELIVGLAYEADQPTNVAEPPDTADGVGLTFTRQVAGGGRDLENSVASGFVS